MCPMLFSHCTHRAGEAGWLQETLKQAEYNVEYIIYLDTSKRAWAAWNSRKGADPASAQEWE